ncbi:MAG: TonB-dependent receptor [Bacteroidaceae bacterium]|nr:TonB-dependent receptor [Bacteroidaceae bacterium]
MLSCLIVCTVLAQQSGDAVSLDDSRMNDSDSTVHYLKQVDVAGHRTERNVLASKPIQQMQKAELEELGIQNLADAVKKFAGTNVRDYGGIGGMKTVSVRNLGAHHTAVSYDGVTVSNTQAGQIDVGRFSLDNMESLSLAIGADESLMQSARHYASAGVLSILTERPHFDEGKNSAFRFRLKGGSFGLVTPSLRYWQRVGEQTSLALNGSYMRADGVYPFVLVNGRERTNEKRYNSDIYTWQGEANLYHTFADKSQLDMKAYWFYSERGLPGSVTLYNPVSRERLWDEDFFAQAVYRKAFDEKWNLHARLKYTHTWNRYEDTNVKYDGGKQIDVNRQNEYYASATLGWSPVEAFRIALAEDAFYNDLRNNINIGSNPDYPFPKRITSLTALSAQWQWERLHVEGNVVGTYAHETVENGENPADKHRLSPCVSVTYRLLPNESLHLRAMWKNTFRMPSFNDLYYLRIGNSGLRPEKATEYNLGLTWSGRPFQAVKYVSATVDAYYNDVTDKIVAFPSTYVWKMANFGKVKIKGIDVTLATEVPIFHKVSAILTGAYTFQESLDKLEASASYNRQLPYTPKHSGNASLLIRNPWVNLGYSVLFQGERWSSSQQTALYKLKAYSEHTLTLSREFRFKSCQLNLSGSIHNLFDKQYEIVKYYPMPGRSFSLIGTINF